MSATDIDLQKTDPRYVLTVSGQVLNLSLAQALQLRAKLDEILKARRGDAIDNIKAVVSRKFGISIEAIEGQSRLPHIVHARWFAMVLCRMQGYSLSAIGAAFQDRDHSGVHYALTEFASRLELYPHMKTELEFLQSQIQ